MRTDAPTCLNCRWAEWVMTNHKKPRIKNMVGDCVVSITKLMETLPKCMTFSRFALPDHDIFTPGWRRILPTSPHGDCPTWEARP